MQRRPHPAPDPEEPNHGSDDLGTDARNPASKPEPFGPGGAGDHDEAGAPRRNGLHRDDPETTPAEPAAPETRGDQTDGRDDEPRPGTTPRGSDDPTAVMPGGPAYGAGGPTPARPDALPEAGENDPTAVAPSGDDREPRDGDDHPESDDHPDAESAPDRDGDGETTDSDDGDDGDNGSSRPAASNGLKHILLGILGMVVLIVAIRLLAPHVGFLDDTWQKVRKGDPVWLLLGVVLETFSFAGYVWVFNATANRAGLRLPRVTSWRITLAGVAATRLIATAGAGGIAATTFALRRHGLDARAAAATVTAQLAIVYGWFIFLIMLTGLALFVGGHGHAAITIVPAAIAAGILLTAAGGRSVLRKLARVSAQREGRVAEAVAVIPGTLDDAVATVVTLIRERDIAIVGGALWWLADAGVLWAACHAFGASPNVLDVTMAYLLGQTANLLPIPGGLGVEAGLLGMLIAFGVPGGVAVLASLVQRLISTWLPALPGALALASIGRASPDAEVVPVDDDQPPPDVAATAA